MVEISTSILTVKDGEESKVFLGLESGKTDYYAIKNNGEQINIIDELNRTQYNKID